MILTVAAFVIAGDRGKVILTSSKAPFGYWLAARLLRGVGVNPLPATAIGSMRRSHFVRSVSALLNNLCFHLGFILLWFAFAALRPAP